MQASSHVTNDNTAVQVYRPLETDTQTRVLELLPDPLNSPIHGKLHHIDLNDKCHRPYEALSYTWGTNIDEQTIKLDGENTPIRQNLCNFLTQLRSNLTTTKFYWVDAICISQHDNAEKSRQVQMIGRIFKQARRVLAWVGEHSDGSEALFNSKSLRKKANDDMPVDQNSEVSRQKRLSIWTAFLSRPYWNRTWITQEIGIARKIIVYCGADSESWEKLILSRSWTWFVEAEFARLRPRCRFDGVEISSFPSELSTAHQRISTLVELRREFALMRWFRWFVLPVSFFGMLDPSYGTVLVFADSFKETECYDSRDRVYSLLRLEWQDSRLRRRLSKVGIVRPFQQIQVDYDSSLAQVYIHVCMSRISTRYYPPDATHAANLLLCLRLDEGDVKRVVDILLDDLGTGRRDEYMFWVLANAVDISDKLGSLPFDKRDSSSPLLASTKRMRDALSGWRQAQIAAGEWYPAAIPSTNTLAIP